MVDLILGLYLLSLFIPAQPSPPVMLPQSQTLEMLEKHIGSLQTVKPKLYALGLLVAAYGIYKIGRGLHTCKQACLDDVESLEEETGIKLFIKGSGNILIGASCSLITICALLGIHIIEEQQIALRQFLSTQKK